MNRRGFIGSLIGGAAALVAGMTLDHDKLLWVPGAKSVFIPPTNTAIVAVTQAELEAMVQLMGVFRVTDHSTGLACEVPIAQLNNLRMLPDDQFAAILDHTRMLLREGHSMTVEPMGRIGRWS